jgi:hypothetical protein
VDNPPAVAGTTLMMRDDLAEEDGPRVQTRVSPYLVGRIPSRHDVGAVLFPDAKQAVRAVARRTSRAEVMSRIAGIVIAGAAGLALGTRRWETGAVLMITAAVVSTLPRYRDLWQQRKRRPR